MRLASFSATSIEQKITPILSSYFNAEDPTQLASNLISRFYGAPLVDVASATSVAANFFQNFALHVLQKNNGILSIPENEVDTLILIRPERLNDQDSDQISIRDKLLEAKGGELDAPSHPRKKVRVDKVIGRKIVEFPTPLYGLYNSPRYQNLRARLQSAEHFSPEARERAYKKMEAKIIASYFRTIEGLIERDGSLAQRKYKIVPLADYR